MIEHPVDGVKLLLLDADGTLRRCTVPGQPCPNRPGEQELLPNVREVAEIYSDADVPMVICSNQGGIGLGLADRFLVEEAMEELIEMINLEALPIEHAWADCLGALVCPHGPKAGCCCRKPAPGLLFYAMFVTGTFPGETVFVGDQESDKLAAEAAGVRFFWAKDFFGWEEEGSVTKAPA